MEAVPECLPPAPGAIRAPPILDGAFSCKRTNTAAEQGAAGGTCAGSVTSCLVADVARAGTDRTTDRGAAGDAAASQRRADCANRGTDGAAT